MSDDCGGGGDSGGGGGDTSCGGGDTSCGGGDSNTGGGNDSNCGGGGNDSHGGGCDNPHFGGGDTDFPTNIDSSTTHPNGLYSPGHTYPHGHVVNGFGDSMLNNSYDTYSDNHKGYSRNGNNGRTISNKTCDRFCLSILAATFVGVALGIVVMVVIVTTNTA